MASQFQSREQLLKAGFAGFAMLDDIYGRRTRMPPPPPPPSPPTPQLVHDHQYHHHQRHNQYQYYQQQSHVYHSPQVVTVVREPVIDSNQAAQLYGGTVIVEYYSKRKPARHGAF
ncbi:hypothetical protein ACOSQ2_007549 [Xanthoceras sorbifolium]